MNTPWVDEETRARNVKLGWILGGAIAGMLLLAYLTRSILYHVVFQ